MYIHYLALQCILHRLTRISPIFKVPWLFHLHGIHSLYRRPTWANEYRESFATALKDVPTLTELCVLALYSVRVSRPFMQRTWPSNWEYSQAKNVLPDEGRVPTVNCEGPDNLDP